MADDSSPPTSVFDLLQKATVARSAVLLRSHSNSASLKKFNTAERTLGVEERPTHLQISNTYIDAAVAKWKPLFESTVLLSPKATAADQWMREAYGMDESVARLWPETSEHGTHDHHHTDLQLICMVLKGLIQNLEGHAQKQPRLHVFKETDGRDDWSAIPDFRGSLKFDRVSELLARENVEDKDMTLVTMEDKTMKIAQDMFKEKENISVVWPKADGELPKNLTTAGKKTMRGIVQIATQMSVYKTEYAIFYTLERVLYFKRVGSVLVRSDPPDTGAMVDFVQYAAWIMEAASQCLPKYDNWFMAEVFPPTKTLPHEAVSPTVRFALFPSIPLPSWLFDQALAIAPVTRIKFGNRPHDAYDFAKNQKFLRWLPKAIHQSLPVVEIPCFQKLTSADGHNVVAFGMGVVAKISAQTQEFRHECRMALIASNILPYNTPRVIEVYEGHLNMMLLSYTGVALDNWHQLSQSQLEELVHLLDTFCASNFHHHDIRPANVTVDDKGQVYIIDFGNSISVDDDDCEDCLDKDTKDEILEVLRQKTGEL